MQQHLSTDEIRTLQALSARDAEGSVPRAHLEKLSRLDLIEPCAEGICVTGVGRRILVKTK